jgi:hypothetical protein
VCYIDQTDGEQTSGRRGQKLRPARLYYYHLISTKREIPFSLIVQTYNMMNDKTAKADYPINGLLQKGGAQGRFPTSRWKSKR